MESYHPVKQDMLLAFGYRLHHVSLDDANGQLIEVVFHKQPHALFGTAKDFELLRQFACGLIGADYQIFVHGSGSIDHIKTALLLVQNPHVRHSKTRLPKRLLDCHPDIVLRVMEFNRNPPPWLENSKRL